MCRFLILTIWESVHMKKPWKGGVTNFGWKFPLTKPWYFTSQRSTSHASHSFITPGEHQLPQFFCPGIDCFNGPRLSAELAEPQAAQVGTMKQSSPRMVQLLAGIISLRRIRGPNPGRSHGSTRYHYATQPTYMDKITKDASHIAHYNPVATMLILSILKH